MPFVTTKVTQYFFDRTAVTSRLDPARVRLLTRLGSFIMTTARRSMRPSPLRRKLKPGRKRRRDTQLYSKPGQPPFYLTGLLRSGPYGITFRYDPQTESMVVGPSTIDGGKSKTPKTLEYGGVVKVRNRRAVYQPRPYMRPAYELEIKALPSMLKDMI